MPVITDILPQKRHKGRFSLFIDNEFFLGLDEEVLYSAKLQVGQIINPVKLKELVTQEEYSHAKQYVFLLLSRWLYSCHEIRSKLIQKGYEAFIIDKLIEDFLSRKYLNDRQFAESWVENRIAHHPRGLRVLQQELLQKGIDREVIEAVLQSLKSLDTQIIWAEKALNKKKNYISENDPRKRKRKMFQYLAQKGFSPTVIQETVQSIIGKINNKETED